MATRGRRWVIDLRRSPVCTHPNECVASPSFTTLADDSSGEAEGPARRAAVSPMTENGAALALQSAFRGFQVRRDLFEEEAAEIAALRLQAIFRGHKARVALDEELEMLLAAEEEAAGEGAA